MRLYEGGNPDYTDSLIEEFMRTNKNPKKNIKKSNTIQDISLTNPK